MIVVDTSALMSIILDDSSAAGCAAVLEAEDDLLISAATLAEALIVSARVDVGGEMESLVDGLGIQIVSVTPDVARKVARAYGLWGKGVHPAGLNFGDCFAYVAAVEHRCPLLYVGEDFRKTDVQSAL